MGMKRDTCLAAANEAKKIIEKADFMLSRRVGRGARLLR